MFGMIPLAAILAITLLPSETVSLGAGLPRPEEVATSDRQWTGLAVSAEGRIFVNFPRWSLDVPVSVAELDEDGRAVPYPDESWNSWGPEDDPSGKFVCVQSVHVDDLDRLWILDPGNPWLQGVRPGGPKLIQVDLKTNRIARVYSFAEAIATGQSYLNDVRIDTRSGTAFMTDSGRGALIVLDLQTGLARRLLDGHPSVTAENTQVAINGQPLPFVVHSDGIALDARGGWLYYQALTGRTLYRVPTAALADPDLDEGMLAPLVEKFAESGVSDGLLWIPQGIYVSSLEDGTIKRVGPDGRVTVVARDPRILWPDSFARGPGGGIYFTTSLIHLGPQPGQPYRILRLPPPEK